MKKNIGCDVSLLMTAFLPCSTVLAQPVKTDNPNLLVIMTDEHSFRTLGCYRAYLEQEQAFPWGKYNAVETPNIDRLANEGAICLNFYASSPVSTPSRASFQTGLYPIAAGAPINDMPLNPDLETFATVLKEAGYQTNYIGKWHLAGTPALNGQLYSEPGASCGWMDRTYQSESNHQKWYQVIRKPNVIKTSNNPSKEPNNSIYATDFLTDRCLEILQRDKNKSFVTVLSIPDPHSPDIGREPYKSEYRKMDVKMPYTMRPDLVAKRPLWGVGGKNEAADFDPKTIHEYFAMVKCIDDNIGRILKFLDDNKLTNNTIVVFTADHGDLLFEHKRVNKDLPYEASAKIPFIIRYPGKINSNKIIYNTYTCCDFAPTILGIMGERQIKNVHGINDSKVFLSNKKIEESDRIVYMTDSPFNEWTAATDGHYKLVLSCKEHPWLFDLKNDPNEIINEYSNPKYKKIVEKFQSELLRQMKIYKDPSIDLGYHYSLSPTDSITYKSPYQGLNTQQINKIESAVLERLRYNIHKYCFRPLK